MQSTEDIKKLLIITGPQGSGNHLWSKIFAMHPIVVGWPMLRKEWQGHHEEPFNKYWQQPEKLQEFDTDKKYHVKFISTELLFLYGEQYLKALQKELDFPVAWNHATLIKDYLKENTNKKYLIEPDTGAFDEQVYKAVSES